MRPKSTPALRRAVTSALTQPAYFIRQTWLHFESLG
jgi:hypothetical protein